MAARYNVVRSALVVKLKRLYRIFQLDPNFHLGHLTVRK